MGLDGGQDRVDPLHFLEVGLNLQTGPVPWIERKAVGRLIRRVVEPEAVKAALVMISAWLGVCVIGRFSFEGMPCCWAWSVVVELLRSNRMSPMSPG